MTEVKYEFHLTAFEIGLFMGMMSREGFKIRKELLREVDNQIYSKGRR